MKKIPEQSSNVKTRDWKPHKRGEDLMPKEVFDELMGERQENEKL